MKQFLKKIIYISLPIILLAYPVDIFFSTNLKKNYNNFDGEFEIWEKILHQKINDDIFIYGSSRAIAHIDPHIIEEYTDMSCYNLGANGQKTDIQLIRYNLIDEKLPTPKYIIYSVEMTMLEKSKVPFTKEQFYPYMLFNSKLQKEMEDFPKTFSKYDFYVPLLRYRGLEGFYAMFKAIQVSIDSANMKPSRDKGYLPWHGQFTQLKRTKVNRKLTISQSSVENLEKLIAKLLSKGIKVSFVYAPQYYEVTDLFDGEEAVFEIYENLSKKYDIPYFNYLSDSICYNKKYFYNAMHLNEKGSQVFSKKFASDFSKYIEETKTSSPKTNVFSSDNKL